MMRNAALLALLSLFLTPLSFATLPDEQRFVSDERASGGLLQIVSWLNQEDGFTVRLHKEPGKPADSVLLSQAKCKEITDGYRCYIKPFKRRGILITDVFIQLQHDGFYAVTEIVLIDGSFTAKTVLGRHFSHE